jgi:hypothetical protein
MNAILESGEITKVAIMQPYFFPYIGYWQLIKSVNRFVIYDDVNYIKGGWINRNRILINGTPTFFNIPLLKASPNKQIFEIAIDPSDVWRRKLIKMLELVYKKSPHFNEVFPVLDNIINNKSLGLSEYLTYQLKTLSQFISINTQFVETSRCYGNRELSVQSRVLDICHHERAGTYINLPGGRMLYDSSSFSSKGVDLRFISSLTLPYIQRSKGFIPSLSIIDILMEVGPDDISRHLDAFTLSA